MSYLPGTKRGTERPAIGWYKARYKQVFDRRYGYGVGVYEGSVNLELTVTAGEGGGGHASAQERGTWEGVRRVARWARTGLAGAGWYEGAERGSRACEGRTGVFMAERDMSRANSIPWA